MKKIALILFAAFAVLSCKKDDEDQLSPDKKDIVKSIEVTNYFGDYTINIDVSYNSEGLVDVVHFDRGKLELFPEVIKFEYEEGRVTRSVTGSYSGGTTIVPLKELKYNYYADNRIKNVSFNQDYFSVVSEFYYHDSGPSYLIVKKLSYGTLTEDTLEYIQPANEGEKVILRSVKTPLNDCPPSSKEFYSTNLEFEHKEIDCYRSSSTTGTYSGVKNNLSKPVYYAIMEVFSSFDPFYADNSKAMRYIFYKNDGMPEYFVQNINYLSTTTTYEYNTDNSGRVSSIITYMDPGEKYIEVKFSY